MKYINYILFIFLIFISYKIFTIIFKERLLFNEYFTSEEYEDEEEYIENSTKKFIVNFIKNNKKNISNKKCGNNFFESNSFCQLNVNTNKCECKFQKDDIKTAFNSPQICCNEMCNKIPAEKCVSNNEFTSVPYYCNIGGKCKKYEGTIISSHISANNCGTDPLNNQLLLPFSSKDECEKTINVCDKYNNPKNTPNQNRDSCLKDTACGYCRNEFGEGKCISGNPSGPNDLEKYYYCIPQKVNAKNTYEYGNRAIYILQEPTTY